MGGLVGSVYVYSSFSGGGGGGGGGGGYKLSVQ